MSAWRLHDPLHHHALNTHLTRTSRFGTLRPQALQDDGAWRPALVRALGLPCRSTLYVADGVSGAFLVVNDKTLPELRCAFVTCVWDKCELPGSELGRVLEENKLMSGEGTCAGGCPEGGSISIRWYLQLLDDDQII